MAMYTVKYACGHGDHQVNIMGPIAGRAAKAAWYEADYECDACRAKAASDKLAANTATIEAAVAPLPALTGSEKQIAWAAKIRVAGLMDAREYSALGREPATDAAALAWIAAKKESRWWIDRRDKKGYDLLEEAHAALRA